MDKILYQKMKIEMKLLKKMNGKYNINIYKNKFDNNSENDDNL